MCDSKVKTVEIQTENIKLDSFLKFVGLVSTGGEAKEIINEGKVSVDGALCFSRGKKLAEGSVVCVDNKNFYEVKACENS